MKYLSQIIVAASGSVGGLVFSRNRSGNYTRGRAIPVNPNSTRQAAVRAAMASMVSYWHITLTAPQRAAWDTYASNTPLTDALGQQQTVTGQNMFLRANILSEWRGLPTIDAAPTVFDLGEPVISIDSLVVAAGIITWTFTVGGAGTPTTCRKLLYIGVAQNAGRTFFRGPYQLASDTAGAAATTAFVVANTLALPGAWFAAYQPEVGDLLPIKMSILYDDGRLATAFRTIITVT